MVILRRFAHLDDKKGDAPLNDKTEEYLRKHPQRDVTQYSVFSWVISFHSPRSTQSSTEFFIPLLRGARGVLECIYLVYSSLRSWHTPLPLSRGEIVDALEILRFTLLRSGWQNVWNFKHVEGGWNNFCISNKFITFAVCLSSEFILWIYNI